MRGFFTWSCSSSGFSIFNQFAVQIWSEAAKICQQWKEGFSFVFRNWIEGGSVGDLFVKGWDLWGSNNKNGKLDRVEYINK